MRLIKWKINKIFKKFLYSNETQEYFIFFL